uniref:Uncharacterized protein n=1 Tax=Nymphaea colorata TaxID=210225 RepID=A0A5K0W8Q7_9MAGN
MAVFVSSRDALQPGWLLAHLKAIDPSQIRDMRVNLAQVRVWKSAVIITIQVCLFDNAIRYHEDMRV